MAVVNDDPIQVIGVTKTIGDKNLIENITFSLKRNSLTGLIGPNGAGKTTLLKIILGLDSAHDGKVNILPEERIRYIPQIQQFDTFALPLSVYEYLSIGVTPLYRQKKGVVDFKTALKHVGVSQEIVNQSFSSLSGGEQQRIAIARALLSEPTILVLDEPLASVDYSSRPKLYELLRHIQQTHKITLLLVSHDVDSIIPICDTLLCLNKTLRRGCQLKALKNDFEGIDKTVNHHC